MLSPPVAPSPVVTASASDPSPLLDEEIANHLVDLERRWLAADTNTESKHTLRIFAGVIGNLPVREIKATHVRASLDAVRWCVENAPRHRHQEFLSFLREIENAVPANLDIHCTVDNYATHSHPKVKAWLAVRPRGHMHFILTYSAWLNHVERFFGLMTDKVIRRGSFHSVRQLVNRIDHFIEHYNENCQPFRSTATAESILAKLRRLCSRISETGHQHDSVHRIFFAVSPEPGVGPFQTLRGAIGFTRLKLRACSLRECSQMRKGAVSSALHKG